MNKTEIEEIKDIFDSIVCFCVEGVEFMDHADLATKINEEAIKGYKLCQNAILTSQYIGQQRRPPRNEPQTHSHSDIVVSAL